MGSLESDIDPGQCKRNTWSDFYAQYDADVSCPIMSVAIS